MDQDETVNSALRELRFKNIIKEEDSNQTQLILQGVWTAGWEYQREENKKNRQGTARKIDYYDRDDKKLDDFDSIEEAANKLEIPRKTIYSTLSGKFKRMRNGHYFRYATDGDNTDNGQTNKESL
jgi:hypothetical protein